MHTLTCTFAGGRTVVTAETDFWLPDEYFSAAFSNMFCYILCAIAFRKEVVIRFSVFIEGTGCLGGLR
jgi:hypothetical protein